MRRYIFTGAPGAGKTTLLAALAAGGYAVVDEAVTDLIESRQAEGVEDPWTDPDFLSVILTLQQHRQAAATSGDLTLFDRSPVCTLALARYGGHRVPADLRDEVARLARDGFYQREVFMVRPIGFIERTAVRRISYDDSLRFERIHEQTYTEFGFCLVDVPPAPVAERVEIVEEMLRGLEPRP